MLKFKEAVTRSRELLEDVQPVTPTRVRLEEAELTDDERYWQVTFSYWVPEDNIPDRSLPDVSSSIFRKHTMIKVRAEDGELFGVRNLAA